MAGNIAGVRKRTGMGSHYPRNNSRTSKHRVKAGAYRLKVMNATSPAQRAMARRQVISACKRGLPGITGRHVIGREHFIDALISKGLVKAVTNRGSLRGIVLNLERNGLIPPMETLRARVEAKEKRKARRKRKK